MSHETTSHSDPLNANRVGDGVAVGVVGEFDGQFAAGDGDGGEVFPVGAGFGEVIGCLLLVDQNRVEDGAANAFAEGEGGVCCSVLVGEPGGRDLVRAGGQVGEGPGAAAGGRVQEVALMADRAGDRGPVADGREAYVAVVDDLNGRRLDGRDADRVGDDVLIGVVAELHDQFVAGDRDFDEVLPVAAVCRVVAGRLLLVDEHRGQRGSARAIEDGERSVRGAVGVRLPRRRDEVRARGEVRERPGRCVVSIAGRVMSQVAQVTVAHCGGSPAVGRAEASVAVVYHERRRSHRWRTDDGELVVLDFAVGSEAEERVAGGLRDAEAGDRRSDRAARSRDAEGVGTVAECDIGEDLFARIVPVAVAVEVDPAVEDRRAGHGRIDRHTDRRAELQAAAADHDAVFVRGAGRVVAGCRRVGLTVGLCIGSRAEEDRVAGEDVPRSVVSERGREGGRVGRVAKIERRGRQRRREVGLHDAVVGEADGAIATRITRPKRTATRREVRLHHAVVGEADNAVTTRIARQLVELKRRTRRTTRTQPPTTQPCAAHPQTPHPHSHPAHRSAPT